VTTALQTAPAPNWYPDPSGRADARYWDGRMWTSHVVRDGVTTLDPIDGVQQPREPARFEHGVRPTNPVPTVGHGTAALQEMAAARPVSAPAPLRLRTAEPRISTAGAMAVFLGSLLLISVGVYLFRQGAFTVDASPQRLTDAVTVDDVDYRAQVPSLWIARTPFGSLFDSVYSIPDADTVNVGIVDVADPALADPNARDQHVALVSETVARAIGPAPALVDRSATTLRHRHVTVAIYDITDPSGIVTRVREYLVAGPDRAVIVTAYGTPAAVDRHMDAVADVATTVRIK
jgi:hypothetical protein